MTATGDADRTTVRMWADDAAGLVPRSALDPLDHGFTLGDGVFETIRVVGRRPVFWSRHLARLRRSLTAIGLSLAADDAALTAAVNDVLADDEAHRPLGSDASDRGDRRDRRLRLTVTSGPGPLGPTRPTGPATVTVAVTAGGAMSAPVRLVTVDDRGWVRNERSPLAGVKSTSYGAEVAVLAHVRGVGADEALLADTVGRLSEAMTANVLVALEGVLVTPGRASGCLPGVVRSVLLDAGVLVEADLPLDAVHRAAEVALTSATRGVVAASHVDGRALAEAPGPLVRQAAAALAEATAADLAGPRR